MINGNIYLIDVEHENNLNVKIYLKDHRNLCFYPETEQQFDIEQLKQNGEFRSKEVNHKNLGVVQSIEMIEDLTLQLNYTKFGCGQSGNCNRSLSEQLPCLELNEEAHQVACPSHISFYSNQ